MRGVRTGEQWVPGECAEVIFQRLVLLSDLDYLRDTVSELATKNVQGRHERPHCCKMRPQATLNLSTYLMYDHVL
jgi:hypothetical protein